MGIEYSRDTTHAVGPVGKFSELEPKHTVSCSSAPHVRPLSKISFESGMVAGSQRYSFHDGK